MTKQERANPGLLQASRKKRIAKGAGLEVSELNKLLKMHRQMADVMKKISQKGGKGMLKQAVSAMRGKALPGMDGNFDPASIDPSKMDPKELEATARKLGMGGLGGMGGGMPGMGGLPNMFGKKK
jgi:signal recognition particle subunit SRP54